MGKYIAFILIVTGLGFLFIGIPYIIYQDELCKQRGGIPTRIGCLKPEIFK